MQAFLAWAAANLLPNFLKALFGAGQTAVDTAQTRADQVSLGQAQQKQVDTEAAVAAGERIDAAAAQPIDVAERLDHGTF